MTEGIEEMKLRADLGYEGDPGYKHLFVDGSCYKNEIGQSCMWYSVILGDPVTDRFKVLRCKGMRHGHMSAQCAELMALIEACEIGKGLEINVNTDMW